MTKVLSLAMLLLCLFANTITAQNISFSFANAVTTTNGANGSYEADVLIASDTDFKLGTGQLYFNYNTAAFGDNLRANDRAIFTAPDASYILGQVAGFPIYTSFIVNDNTTSRISFAWDQALAAVCIPAENVTSTPQKLLRIQFDFIAGGENEDPNVCFEMNAPFDTQTYTACGPFSGACTFANCTTSPGTRLINDDFDCALAALPLELVEFDAIAKEKYIQLDWMSMNEINFDAFELERSTDGRNFEFISEITGIGGENRQQYDYEDNTAEKGVDYYYRLKMRDLDGEFEYSNVRSAALASSISVAIYPNPTSDILNVDFGETEVSEIIIQNNVGHEYLRLSATELENYLDISSFPDGMYFLLVLTKNRKTLVKQFVKTR